MGPESLCDRHDADEEVSDFHWSASSLLSERVRMVLRPTDEGEIEDMTMVPGVPNGADALHG
jgi:hypothetical protein